ncbi:MAG: SDR family NAD(P)-dependent oxidoreductase [Spirochaetales bacterium]|nr:SDR family NAD(P)-dependent oxidoreductase [Spirochaetales bacterium]
MEQNTCLITGANSGIGRAAALQFARLGWRVLLGCRNRERGLEAEAGIRGQSGNREVRLVAVDMSLQESVRRAADEVGKTCGRLDALIHNAADFDLSRKTPVFTKEGVESVWATNHVGPVLLTDLMLDALKKSPRARIVTVASKGLLMHPLLKIRLDDPEFKNGGYSVQKAYYQSKLAQVMYTYWLAERLKGTGVSAACVRVTNVKIDIHRYPNLSPFMKFMYSIKSKSSISPERMAETYVFAATAAELPAGSGSYLDEHNRAVASSAYSRDPENIAKVMELTGKYMH